MSRFTCVPHAHIAARKRHPPRTVEEQHDLELNGRIAKAVTEDVGTMWCAYAFAALALVALPSAIKVLAGHSEPRRVRDHRDNRTLRRPE